MQQTDKYQLNLIDPSDTFSPDPLNENMKKMEAAIAAEAAALGQRLQTIEAHHLIVSSFTGDGNINQDILLGFTPSLVMVPYGSTMYTVLPGTAMGSGTQVYLRIIDGGFRASYSLNAQKIAYPFLALN